MKTVGFGNILCFFCIIAIACLFFAIPTNAGGAQTSVSVGQNAPPFRTRALGGRVVNFPADYKGKVVLLDFWATWCGPCREELPNVIATYKKFHSYGFDAVSVSLDKPRNGPALLQFVRANNMNWPQIYDGRYWKAAVAMEYGIKSIPCPVLVDGDTGKIIALGGGARADQLPLAVEKALEAKGRKLPGLGPYNPNAPDKLAVAINGQTVTVWRTGQLKDAKKQAVAEHKPIAWILSNPHFLDGIGQISSESSRGATLHALYAFRNRAVLVFQDAYSKNENTLPSVNAALRAIHGGWTTPYIAFLNPEGTQVLATVGYEPDFVKRAQLLANALGKVGAKMNGTAPGATGK